MTIHIFCSYTRKDKTHKKDLETHLSTLKANQQISSWSDSEILPGSKITKEIKDQIKKADIILLLLSSDFLSSNSCKDEIEMALNLEKQNKTTVIPIVLRDCSWKDTALGKLLALPKDGKAVTKWNNKDSAWFNVYEGIQKRIEQIQNDRQPTIKIDFKKKLLENSTGSESLDHQFVYPDIINNNTVSKKLENNEISAQELIKLDRFKNPYIFLDGDDQCGKTALSNILFLEYFNSGLYPVFIECNKLPKNISVIKVMEKGYKSQYENWQKCVSSPKEKRILLIDDIDEININKETFYKFISSVQNHFKGAIVLTNQLVSLSIEKSKYNYFSHFQKYSIMPFGYRRRDELIRKRISLDEKTDFDIGNTQHIKKLDQCAQYIDTIIGSNIVPSYPVFILSILDSIKLIHPNQDLQKTSYGHCYHAMITMLLYKIQIKPEEYDSYFNFLTQLAYWMFNKNLKNISKVQLDEFLESYKENYIIPKQQGIENVFLRANIIKIKNNLYSFKYVYVYYYFVAKHIAENIETKEARKIVRKLIQTLYLKDNSNILVFITHHTKNKDLIRDITGNTSNIFKQFDEATLSGDEKDFIKNLHKAFKDIQLPSSSHSVETERKRQLIDKDRRKPNTEQTSSNEESNDLLSNEIGKSIKKMEIIGQILRNQYGSLEKKQLKSLFQGAQNVGLRLLKSFMECMLNEREILEYLIRNRLEQNAIKKEEKLSLEQIEHISKITVDQISYSILFGLLHKIVDSIGYHKIINIADMVNQENNTVASKLINLYIHTWYKKELDFKKITSLYKEFENDKNHQAIYILKHIVSRHIYMHNISYKYKQKIANLLDFSIKKQILAQKKLK